jgi:hypothetical protein
VTTVTRRRTLAIALGAAVGLGSLAGRPHPGPAAWMLAVAVGAVCAAVLAWRLRPDNPKEGSE